jgi:hypothetical protein
MDATPARALKSAANASSDLVAYTGDWDHQATADWLATKPGYLCDYADEWVAFAGRHIIAHGPDLNEVMRLAREQGISDPLLVPVPPRGYITG